MKRLGLIFIASVAFTATASAGVLIPVTPEPSNNDASPTFMIGISVEFGEGANAGDVGITGKVLSTNRPNEFVVGAGLSYFPWSTDKNGPIGFDISAGYNFDHVTAMGGYDFLRWKPQISVGYTPTKEEDAEPLR